MSWIQDKVIKDHGDLSGLSDDDHPQYLLIDGTRAMTGALAMGAFRITGMATPVAGTDATTKDYVDVLVQGLSWQEPVEDKDLTTPPGSPSVGDRYIVAAVATGAWTGQEDDIAEWNGSSWDFTTPLEGYALWVKDEDIHYVFNGSSWIQLASTTDHGSLSGLGDDDHSQYVHISAARSISAQHSFAPGVVQAPFLLGANAQGQLVTGLNADQLDGNEASAFALASHTHAPADITPQGTGSGLDADLLDGNEASAFALASHTHAPADITPQGAGSGLDADLLDGSQGTFFLARANHTGTQAPATISPQGAASGLDADLLDGNHASAFALASHTHAPADITPQGSGSTLDADLLDGSEGAFYLARANHTGTQAPATISPQGTGSGLDADTVDGLQASAFALTSHTHVEADITDLDHDAVAIQGVTVDSTAPTDGQVLAYDGAVDNRWEPTDLSALGVGDLELVETKNIAVATASTTFSGLAGDTDKRYVLLIDFRNGAGGTSNLAVRPNGLSGSVIRNRAVAVDDSGTVTGAAANNWVVAQPTTGGTAHVVMFLHADKTTATRRYGSFSSTYTTGSGTTAAWTSGGVVWNNTSTELTSIEITTSAGGASDIAVGTRISLYKVVG